MTTHNNSHQPHAYSAKVKAGKRTYFLDVKKTRGGDKYLVITESRKCLDKEGGIANYTKTKIFLYKEDLDKFSSEFTKSINYIKENISKHDDSQAGYDEYDQEN